MTNREGFAVIFNFILILGVTAIYWLQQIASVEQCSCIAWILLLPSAIYYTGIMTYFDKHERVFTCEPPASKFTCFMSMSGCLTLLAVALLHTRVAHYEITVLYNQLVWPQMIARITTAIIAWSCFLATMGHVEYEKLTYVLAEYYQRNPNSHSVGSSKYP